MKYRHMFSPIKIGKMVLPNRMIMNPIMSYMVPGGYCNERFKQFYYRRAEGGAGLIIVGGARYDHYGCNHNQPTLVDDSYIPGYKEFTDGMHERGVKVGIQFYGAGAYAFKEDVPENDMPIAPSAIKSKFTHEECREMTIDDIKTVISMHAAAAKRAKEAGFDFIEILGSAGYLITQFLSPSTNHRTDEYGGSVENRLRFPLELIKATREAVGPDFPIGMRMAGNDLVPGANTNAEAVIFAKAYEAAGIDMLNVTGGWHESLVPQITGDLPVSGFAYLAEAIKKEVSIPVCIGNRNIDPLIANRMIAMGQVDLIGGARPYMADPDYAKKVFSGHEDEVRHCVGCNQGCLANSFTHVPVSCILNPFASFESEYVLTPVKDKKKILVIGAGPAGCECALIAAERGHDVTIWEKSDLVAGTMGVIAKVPTKEDFLKLEDSFAAELKAKNVKIILQKEATAENIAAEEFDEIVVATGSTPKDIKLNVTDNSVQICNAVDILTDSVEPGKNIVVVGGGAVGCEVAQYMGRQGTLSADQVYYMMLHNVETPDRILSLMKTNSRNISIVEVSKKIGSNGFDPGTAWPCLKDLKRLGVKNYVFTTVKEVGNNSVTLNTKSDDGEIITTVPCDTLVLAVGYTPNNSLYEQLKSKFNNIHVIGDSSKVGKIKDATTDGLLLGLSL